MKVAFQELKVGDEFTDETGIKYRKIHENKFCGPRHEKTAMVINHPVLGGTEVLINPGIPVNKIIQLTKIGNMVSGAVFKLVNGNYAFKLFYETNRTENNGIKITSKVVDMKDKRIYDLDSEEKFEVVGNINLSWPAQGCK